MKDLVCSSCDEPKAQLAATTSQVLPGVRLYLCRTCKSKRYEPRWCLVLAGRSFGVDKVEEYLLQERYVGDPISFKEVVKV